jgi:DNA-binding response OmpR family regulator
MSGIELVKLIRKDNYKIPIILLTAYSKTDILMEATRLKLVNYITKPIIYEELYDSLSIAVEEIARFKGKIFKLYDNTVFDFSLKILYQNDKEIHLTSSENRLLTLLLENANKTVTIDTIKNELWHDPVDATESALKSILTKLRSKVGKQSIKNVSGVGYYIQARLDLQ